MRHGWGVRVGERGGRVAGGEGARGTGGVWGERGGRVTCGEGACVWGGEGEVRVSQVRGGEGGGGGPLQPGAYEKHRCRDPLPYPRTCTRTHSRTHT